MPAFLQMRLLDFVVRNIKSLEEDRFWVADNEVEESESADDESDYVTMYDEDGDVVMEDMEQPEPSTEREITM